MFRLYDVRTISVLVALLVAVTFATTKSAKATVVASYGGTITETTGIMAFGPFSVGDPFSITFTYDETTPDSELFDPGTGSYQNAVTSYTVTAGPYTAQGLFQTGDIGIQPDQFHLTDGFPSGDPIGGRFPTFLNLLFTDSSGLYTSDALPSAPPQPGKIESTILELQFANLSGATGLIQSTDLVLLAVTPVPAALPLFLSGLGTLGVIVWRRRKRPTLA